jgi:nitronate monooxygenase
MWPDKRLMDMLGITCPIIQAPMAGADSPQLAAAVSAQGGLGSLGCALRSADQIAAAVRDVRNVTDQPFNLNFFCHQPPPHDVGQDGRWLARLAPYYDELGVALPSELSAGRDAFDAELCDLVCELAPAVVSFHFGLPPAPLVARVRAAGCRILSSATTPAEAVWLVEHGVDAVIAQGVEAGGHRGVFASSWQHGSGQIGTLALVPQVADAVDVPVIAAGGIADGRGIAASFALGASGVQIGTAFLRCPESAVSPLHRAALDRAQADATVLTNVFTGRPARSIANRMTRELGPIDLDAPSFPRAAAASLPLRLAAEAAGSGDFSSLWAGQAAALARVVPAAELVRWLAEDARMRIARA